MDVALPPEHVHSRSVAGDALCRRQPSPECDSVPAPTRAGGRRRTRQAGPVCQNLKSGYLLQDDGGTYHPLQTPKIAFGEEHDAVNPET
uniref:Predicted protein n=1 Tax=Hordeum vulgare subsp. vulgare TaxID=112509 RepID=F2D8W4_HORVV|nr:predicted protein [Hordeum vulgare subsp. vulgare]